MRKFLPLGLLLLILMACALPGELSTPANDPVQFESAAATAVAATLTALAPPAAPEGAATPAAANPTQALSLPLTQSGVTETPAAGGGFNPPTVGVPSAAPPAAPAAVGPLPAAVYFLSRTSGTAQVWRLASDGVTLQQISAEPAVVDSFDISPVDGRLVMASGNDLVLLNPDGSGRFLLLDGPPVPSDMDEDGINKRLGSPRWSPDGQTIAYGLNGINLMSAAGGNIRSVLPNSPVPKAPDYNSGGTAYFYYPEAWSPDGKRLLVSYSIWPEAGGLAVLHESGALSLLSSPDGMVCCNPTWTLDGQSIFYASPVIGMISAGLWRADPNSGSSITLIRSEQPDGSFHLPGFPHLGRDGKLYYFFTVASGFPESTLPLSLVRAEADGIAGRSSLRGDSYAIDEALWSPDDRGVLIVDAGRGDRSTWPAAGQLVWLTVDGAPALTLPAQGWQLQWGR